MHSNARPDKHILPTRPPVTAELVPIRHTDDDNMMICVQRSQRQKQIAYRERQDVTVITRSPSDNQPTSIASIATRSRAIPLEI